MPPKGLESPIFRNDDMPTRFPKRVGISRSSILEPWATPNPSAKVTSHSLTHSPARPPAHSLTHSSLTYTWARQNGYSRTGCGGHVRGLGPTHRCLWRSQLCNISHHPCLAEDPLRFRYHPRLGHTFRACPSYKTFKGGLVKNL